MCHIGRYIVVHIGRNEVARVWLDAAGAGVGEGRWGQAISQAVVSNSYLTSTLQNSILFVLN